MNVRYKRCQEFRGLTFVANGPGQATRRARGYLDMQVGADSSCGPHLRRIEGPVGDSRLAMPGAGETPACAVVAGVLGLPDGF